VTAGGLAGLFTDRVLQQMQRMLGATDPDKHASQQDTPWTPTAAPSSPPPDTAGATTPVEVHVRGSSKPAGKKGKKSGPAHPKRASVGEKKPAAVVVEKPETPGPPTT
jgi:hypothetical protein